MDIKNKLLEQMSSDLNIYQFNDEPKVEYLNRLIYSAISTWTIHTTLDKSFNENYDKKGVSKSYITRKISKIISQYTEIFPTFRVFLDGLTESEFAKEIRGIFEKAGYIVPAGFDEFVIASKLKTAKIHDGLFLIRNEFNSEKYMAAGVGMFFKENSNCEDCSLEDFFYLPKINARKWTEEYIKKIKWVDASKLGSDTQFFDAKKTRSFSQCWVEQFPDSCGITLYKINNWDYGFARKNNKTIIGIKIPDWLIGIGGNESEKLFDNDVRRFMYGLKAINNNMAKCIVYRKSDYFEIQLINSLPTRELAALQFFGWRKKGFLNQYNYIIPCELFETVKHILEKLSMVILEE